MEAGVALLLPCVNPPRHTRAVFSSRRWLVWVDVVSSLEYFTTPSGPLQASPEGGVWLYLPSFPGLTPSHTRGIFSTPLCPASGMTDRCLPAVILFTGIMSACMVESPLA